MNKSNQLMLKLDDRELERLRKLAEQEGLNPQSYLRHVIKVQHDRLCAGTRT